MPQSKTTTTQRNQVPIPESEFSLETAYGSVKPISDGRNIDQIIRDAKDEKASTKSSATTKPSTKSPTSKTRTNPTSNHLKTVVANYVIPPHYPVIPAKAGIQRDRG